MGLSIKPKRGKNYPVLTCDICDQAIQKLDSAIITFPNPLTKGNVAISGIYHKVKCDPKSLGNRKANADCWMPLNEYIPWLLWNHRFGKRVFTEQKRQLIIDILIDD